MSVPIVRSTGISSVAAIGGTQDDALPRDDGAEEHDAVDDRGHGADLADQPDDEERLREQERDQDGPRDRRDRRLERVQEGEREERGERPEDRQDRQLQRPAVPEVLDDADDEQDVEAQLQGGGDRVQRARVPPKSAC